MVLLGVAASGRLYSMRPMGKRPPQDRTNGGVHASLKRRGSASRRAAPRVAGSASGQPTSHIDPERTRIVLSLRQIVGVIVAVATLVGGGLWGGIAYVDWRVGTVKDELMVVEMRLGTKLDELGQRMKNWTENPNRFPGADVSEPELEEAEPDGEAEEGSEPPEPEHVPKVSSLKGEPDKESPPVCIDKSTRRTIECSRAEFCYKPSYFRPEWIAQIREDAGAPNGSVCEVRGRG